MSDAVSDMSDTALPTDSLLDLFRAIVDCESVSRNEARLADLVEQALDVEHLQVVRRGNTLVARTQTGRPERVVIAGHLDTVPVAGNLPSHLTDDDGIIVHGRGTADMKGGIAVMVWLARELTHPTRDITWVFYEAEEIEASANGLGHLVAQAPELIEDASVAIVMEPTSAQVEAGCQGTMRFWLTIPGRAAHSARSWLGDNAIHHLREVIERIESVPVGPVEVDGLTYREGLNATMVSGGVAGNVIPDQVRLQINYRFAPDKDAAQARALMEEVFAEWPMEIADLSDSARPGLDRTVVADFIEAVGTPPKPKYGWTDVARFTALGIPALNYGPADAGKAHTIDECCPLAEVEQCAEGLRRWLSA